MNCLIENEYIKEKKEEKTEKTWVFTNEFPNWKRILKGKKWKNNGKNKLAYFITGGFIIFFFRELAYFIAGGLKSHVDIIL